MFAVGHGLGLVWSCLHELRLLCSTLVVEVAYCLGALLVVETSHGTIAFWLRHYGGSTYIITNAVCALLLYCCAQVDALSGSMSRPMQSVSMGSSEGFDMAERALHLASKQGYVLGQLVSVLTAGARCRRFIFCVQVEGPLHGGRI